MRPFWDCIRSQRVWVIRHVLWSSKFVTSGIGGMTLTDSSTVSTIFEHHRAVESTRWCRIRCSASVVCIAFTFFLTKTKTVFVFLCPCRCFFFIEPRLNILSPFKKIRITCRFNLLIVLVDCHTISAKQGVATKEKHHHESLVCPTIRYAHHDDSTDDRIVVLDTSH